MSRIHKLHIGDDGPGAMIAPRMYLSKRFAALPPRQKLIARAAFYGGLIALIALAVLAVAYLGQPIKRGQDAIAFVDELAATPEVQLLRDYIRIDTSTTTGSEVAGAEFLAEHLESAGLEVHIERMGNNRANLWAVLEGESPEAVVLHNHIDVSTPGDPEDWVFPPFDAVIDQAWLYGRGVFDMKSLAVAQLLTITEMAQSDERPQKSIVFLASGSEEVGSDLGSKWIVANHPQLTDRFSVVLTEGGVIEAVSHNDVKYWGIEFAQKWFATGWACSSSRRRLEQLREDLDQLSETNHDLRLTPEVAQFLGSYADSRGLQETQRILRDVGAALDHPHKFATLPPYLKSLFRDETATFDIHPNADGGYRLRFILHLLPGSDFEQVKAKLVPDWVTLGVPLSIEQPVLSGQASPVDSPTFQILVDSVHETYPDATVGSYLLAWSATDARFFRQAGIPAYGFSPFLIFATDTFRRDTLNERIDLLGYVNGVNLYKRAVQKLAG